MSIVFLGLTVVLVLLYAHLSTNIEKYANSGNLASRAIILATGLTMAALGAFLLLENVAEPGRAFGMGFLINPLLAVGACVYLIVGFFFPLNQVQGLLRYSFRHRLTDDIRP